MEQIQEKKAKNKIYLEKIKERKIKNERLHELVMSLSDKKKIEMSNSGTLRIHSCGSWLQFLADKGIEKTKLVNGIFCNNRFCPICGKKKALKDAVEIKVMTEYVMQELKRQYIFVTFTAPNVSGEKLSEEITRYYRAFNHFIKLKKYKNVIKGYIRKLEVTYNNDKKSKSYKTYHPHFHVLISVSSSYFVRGNYIKQADWLKDWQEVMQDESITQVDVRRLKTKTKDMLDKSILEITKYIAKDSNYLLSEEVFSNFYKGLKGKRQYGYGGDFKVARTKLKNKELEDYFTEDVTEWYWLLTNRWENKNYTEEKTRVQTNKETGEIQELDIDNQTGEITKKDMI